MPMELSIEGDAPVLQASVLMGVCSDICVPASASFTLPLDFASPDSGQDIRIAQALALTPIPWTASSDPIGEVSFDAAAEQLRVRLLDPSIDPGSVIADAAESGHLFGAPQKSPEESVVTLPLLGGGEDMALDGRPIQLIFMTREGPFEVSRRVVPSTGGGL